MGEDNKYNENQNEINENNTAPVEANEDVAVSGEIGETYSAPVETDGSFRFSKEGIDAEVKPIEQTGAKVSAGAIAAIAAIAAVVIAVVAVVVVFMTGIFEKTDSAKTYDKKATEKYNAMYLDIWGMTFDEFTDQEGFEVHEYIEVYDLPKDLTPQVNAYAAINLMPVGSYMEKVQGIDFEVAKQFYRWDDSVTEDTPMGEAMDKATLERYVGVDYVDYFKSLYGLDDSVTKDTLYGEVRPIIEQMEIEKRKAEEEAAAAAAAAAEEAEASAEENEEAEADATEETTVETTVETETAGAAEETVAQ